MADQSSNKITALENLASGLWLHSPADRLDLSVVERLYHENKSSPKGLAVLEISCYLENYIWHLFPEDSNTQIDYCHIMSVVLLSNEKYRQGLPAADYLTKEARKFHLFIVNWVDVLVTRNDLPIEDMSLSLELLMHLFRNIENEEIRKNLMKYASLPLWSHLSSARRSLELDSYPHLQEHWEDYERSLSAPAQVIEAEDTSKQSAKKRKKSKKIQAEVESGAEPEPKVLSSGEALNDALLVPQLFNTFFSLLDTPHQSLSDASYLFILRFCEFCLDLLSQLPTRRFFNTYLDDQHLIVKCKRSPLWNDPGRDVFVKMVGLIERTSITRVDDQTGEPLTEEAMRLKVLARIHQLRKIAFLEYPTLLKDVIYGSTGELSNPSTLRKILELLSDEEMLSIAVKLCVVSESSSPLYREMVVDLLLHRLTSSTAGPSVGQLPLYPTEATLFDLSLIPEDSDAVDRVYPLPKLNMQFLSVHDYLTRNWELYRLESAYDIRLNICDAVKHMNPVNNLKIGASVQQRVTVFNGWARMAVPIVSISLGDVGKPHIGEVVPSRVTAYVEIDISRFNGDVRNEWEALREHDVVFLISIANPKRVLQEKDAYGQIEQKAEVEIASFCSEYGVKFIRGGEIMEMKDAEGVALNDFSRPDGRGARSGGKRTLTLSLDTAQYYEDIKAGVDCYEPMNLLVRRKSKENNFKAVLETLRDMISMQAVEQSLPSWIRDVLLGYGDPAGSHYRNITVSSVERIPPDEVTDYLDTFIDYDHLLESFPHADITVAESSQSSSNPSPPFKLSIQRSGDREGKGDVIEVLPYTRPLRSPYPDALYKKNTTRFTPRQIEAIRGGLNEGLTLIVGPPGTGKSDTAVQIATALYHNYPNQRILLVTHSNAALNDLFAKIEERDIDPRHLLRLGSGEKDITLRDDDGEEQERYSKLGRVNWSLQRRLDMLAEVQRLAVSLGAPGDVGYSCETAEYFFRDWVAPHINKFYQAVVSSPVASAFPFKEFFNDVSDALFDETKDASSLLASADMCISHIKSIFDELADFRAFELLRSAGHRADYLLTKQARIIAMTCTHAAIVRKRLIELDFKYDSLIMEEAGQVLEIETLIPMLLQNIETAVDACRLKRVVLIGDHNQLPPVVKNSVFKNYSKFDQSLFSRFIRIGVPTVSLEKQGRCRPEIADLFNWRYKFNNEHLGNLPVVLSDPVYRVANAGFLNTYQVIDVGPFNGKGEHCPTPFFYQNLGEAEYVVAVYQYMRLLGYPKESISILTTYNGQKDLIRDIINRRCKGAMFGQPAAITTVDKFQGQQSDYVLLSLVRTNAVGHLRDVRRLVVAMSRARLGLYVFCRQSLFSKCIELLPAFSQLTGGLSKDRQLELVVGESYPSSREPGHGIADSSICIVDDVTAMGLLVYNMVQRAT